jgi:hypothetical protein
MEHADSVGESYYQHGLKAIGYSFRLLKASLACFIHALFPFAYQNKASKEVSSLNQQMVSRVSNDVLQKMAKQRHPAKG